MDEKKKEGAEAAPEAKKEEKKSGSNKPLFIGLIVGVLVINAVTAFLIINATSQKKDTEVDAAHKADSLKNAEESKHEVGATTEKPIEAIVNIAGTDGERFLKVAISFEYDDKAHPTLGEALGKMEPKIKDLLLDHLSKLTLIEVTEPDAKDKIRKDLLRLVNNFIPPKEGEVRDVYITNYIIQ